MFSLRVLVIWQSLIITSGADFFFLSQNGFTQMVVNPYSECLVKKTKQNKTKPKLICSIKYSKYCFKLQKCESYGYPLS